MCTAPCITFPARCSCSAAVCHLRARGIGLVITHTCRHPTCHAFLPSYHKNPILHLPSIPFFYLPTCRWFGSIAFSLFVLPDGDGRFVCGSLVGCGRRLLRVYSDAAGRRRALQLCQFYTNLCYISCAPRSVHLPLRKSALCRGLATHTTLLTLPTPGGRRHLTVVRALHLSFPTTTAAFTFYHGSPYAATMRASFLLLYLLSFCLLVMHFPSFPWVQHIVLQEGYQFSSPHMPRMLLPSLPLLTFTPDLPPPSAFFYSLSHKSLHLPAHLLCACWFAHDCATVFAFHIPVYVCYYSSTTYTILLYNTQFILQQHLYHHTYYLFVKKENFYSTITCSILPTNSTLSTTIYTYTLPQFAPFMRARTYA